MHKDKWLLLGILCLIVCSIEGYNLAKTVSKYKKTSDNSQQVVASVAESASKSKTQPSAKEASSSSKPADSKNNSKKELSETAKKVVVPSEKSAGEKEQPKAAQISVLPSEQGKEPPAPKKVKAVPVVFTYTDSQAKTVTFHGSWSGKAYEMRFDGNTWKFSTRLNPGEYAYHFRVDGVRKTNPGPVNAAGDNIIKVSPAE